ncbi:hypothetical protein Gbth_093_003 [Gluconobacter thailandicus F149-1 = NBRC 100600]|uniref:Monooxygenase n=1 Tax=Gluconobacter thailandicus NBRC 3257 TaxID=1381097 RepID=A0ABQ0IZD4_GLUTH|nr:FAD-dependent monooxygenase [Gluconobacter thailandicus]KXV54513.1 hypothetical protein AD946_02650 [Gluconobacter thailandicus]GAC89150.1 putative monooxygenase [Gluconobacter thailandicus NBRC 3255]GAD27565.1 putative monooxygenase [Gluconobacter thailandicus NBRC 3257]GAN94799.1 hypothetical protein Gbth_093_003 [Gluconobacter thailandicus F149-1 = NBRC 100600]GBR60198.1 2-polyprenyl-6-methoxyphenol hydroxylase [Gluconobacter thailandicus F149-1 = NBRC 100600]
MATQKILISGASIAGPALAFWLQRQGCDVTVIERAKLFRTGGQNVDIEGPAQDVIRLMGIEEEIVARNTREQGVEFLNGAGKAMARLPKGAVGSLTSAYEILRGELADILHEATRDHCAYRFGTTITGLTQTDSAVSVAFSDGATDTFDLVICAEGVGSQTRRLVMDDDIRFRYLGVHASYFRIPRGADDADWARIYHGRGGVFMLLRPVHNNDTTVLVTFPRKDFSTQELDGAAQKRMLREALQDVGGPAKRVLANLDHDQDFYLGPMSQIVASTWSRGRFALLGDAAWCPSAYTGQGTPLALVGAYILANELMKDQTHTQAFAEYERLMRPYVASGRALYPGVIRLFHPRSLLGIGILRTVEKVLTNSLAQKLFRRFGIGDDEASDNGFILPRYAQAISRPQA